MQPIDSQIASYLNHCENVNHMTEQTMDSKRHTLEQFARETGISSMSNLTNAIINEWIAYQMTRIVRVKPVCARTVNTRLKHISCFIRWLRDNLELSIPVKLGLIEHVKEDPPRRTYFTREQIEHALTFADPTEKLMIKLKFDSGLRINELRLVKLEDIDGREIKVIGKGRKAARVCMTPETRLLLDKYVRKNRITYWLWPSPHEDCKGKPMSKDAIRVKMGRPFKKAGLEGFYPHSMRHSFATDIQRNGAPTEAVQKLMRHSSIATTEIYLHNFNQFLLNDYDQWRAPSATN